MHLFTINRVISKLPQWFNNKQSTGNAETTGDVGLIPGLGISPGGKGWQPTLVFLPGGILVVFLPQRNVAVYSP